MRAAPTYAIEVRISDRYRHNSSTVPHVFDRILSLAEAQHLTGLSAVRLRRLIQEKHLPAKKVGKTWLVLREDVLALAGSPKRHRGRPITPFHGNWALENLDRDRQEWLLYQTAAVLAEPFDGGFRLIFSSIAGESFALDVRAAQRDPIEHWRWVIGALQHWAVTVERDRGHRVHRRWRHEPPNQLTEIARVQARRIPPRRGTAALC